MVRKQRTQEKGHLVGVRFDDEDYERLVIKAKSDKLTLSDTIRRAVRSFCSEQVK